MGTELTHSDIVSPTIMANGEAAKIRVSLYGVGGSLATTTIIVMAPNGVATDITANFRDLSALIPATFLSLFEAEFTFGQNGFYTFFLHESVTGRVWVSSTYVAEWATNIDEPISDMLKLLTEVSRLRTTITRKSSALDAFTP